MKRIMVIIFLVIIAGTLRAQETVTADTSKKWNGIWDPTDPLCPCHDVQKAAEAEYKKMLEEEKKKISSSSGQPVNNNNNQLNINEQVNDPVSTGGGTPPVQKEQASSDNNNNIDTDFQQNDSSNEVQIQIQSGSNPANEVVNQQSQQSSPVSVNSSGNGGSNYPPGIKAKTGTRKVRKMMYNTSKKIKKIIPKRKKKKILLDDCWN